MKTRSAFSMITAIFVIIIMTTVAMFVVNLSGKIVKSTTAQYQREQAMLLAKSYTEYAILAVMSNDRNGTGNCLHTIHGTVGNNPNTGDGYRATVQIKYIGNLQEVGSCGGRILNSGVLETKSPLTIIVDTYIDYKDIDNATSAWLTYHKRTLQKI
jgi:type II secretory pathway pseudopilin PulG